MLNITIKSNGADVCKGHTQSRYTVDGHSISCVTV